jgi:vacuolar-type H+-ATPase subunit E/Vma4
MIQPSMPAAWGQVLERVQVALHDAEVKAAQREAALANHESTAEPAARIDAIWLPVSGTLDARKQDWQSQTQQMEAEVQDADAELNAAEDRLKQWLNMLHTLSQDLATKVSRQV